MMTKKSGLGLLNSVTSANEKSQGLQQASAESIRAVTGGEALYNNDHIMEIRQKRCDRH